MRPKQNAVAAARKALGDALVPLGFVAAGDLFVRATPEISQVACVNESRFGGGAVSAIFIETLLVHGLVPTRARRFDRLKGSENAIASLRLDEIAPDTPPYYMLESQGPFDTLRETIAIDLRRWLVPFLEAARDVLGAIDQLSRFGSARALQLAILCARAGERERSRALFQSAEGDRDAIRRVASQYGIDLGAD